MAAQNRIPKCCFFINLLHVIDVSDHRIVVAGRESRDCQGFSFVCESGGVSSIFSLYLRATHGTLGSTMFRTALISMFLTSAAIADTWTVDDDGKADFDNIQAAVDASSDGDEIIVMPGIYTSTADEVVDMLGKAVWLHSSSDLLVAATTIDGEGVRCGILCESGETSNTIIEGFTISNGFAYVGGGMYNYNSSPTLTNCTFMNNSAFADGGGMYNNWNSDPHADRLCVYEQHHHRLGWWGDVQQQQQQSHADETARSRTTMSLETAAECTTGQSPSPTLINCTFTNNSAGWIGGGMLNESDANPSLENCIFEDNYAFDSGGGMYNNYSSNPTLTNCTFMYNLTTDWGGGGMYNNSNSDPTLTECTFQGNTSIDGGGMSNWSSNPAITNCTFTNNTATDWGWWNVQLEQQPHADRLQI